MKSCMAPLTVKREVPKYEGLYLGPIKNETMASLHVHVTTLTVLVYSLSDVIFLSNSPWTVLNLHIFQQNFSDMKLVITSQSVVNYCTR